MTDSHAKHLHRSTEYHLKVGWYPIRVCFSVSSQIIFQSIQFFHQLILIYVIRNAKVLPQNILDLLMHILQQDKIVSRSVEGQIP